MGTSESACTRSRTRHRSSSQALDDRGVTVDASTLLHGEEGAGAQLAVLTAPAAREVLYHAVEALDSFAVVDEVAAVMDSVGAA